MNPQQPERDLQAPDLPGWAEAEAALQAAPMLSPAIGFSRRWRLHLTARRARHARRQSLWSLGLALGGALAALAVWALLGPLGAPADMAVELAVRAAAWGRGLDLLLGLADALLGALPLVLRALGGLGLLFTLGWLSALWLASLYRLSVQEIRNGG
jgi:hypothetical protein